VIKHIVLVDLDHTLRDASRRDDMLAQCRETDDWEYYHSDAIDDEVCTDVLHIIKALQQRGFSIIGITAVPERYRGINQRWLSYHKIRLDELLMHKRDFWEPSAPLKIALARERFGDDFASKILVIIDDHPEVIAAFREAGVTGLQIHGRKYK